MSSSEKNYRSTLKLNFIKTSLGTSIILSGLVNQLRLNNTKLVLTKIEAVFAKRDNTSTNQSIEIARYPL